MTQKLSSDQKGAATVIALRLPSSLMDAIGKVQAQQEALLTVKTSLSTSTIARSLLEEALRARGVLPSLTPALRTEALKEPASRSRRKAQPTPTVPTKGPKGKAPRKGRVRAKGRG